MALPDFSGCGVGYQDGSSPDHHVRTDLYEERTTPGSGIGAFATGFIASGTRIFCEEALVLLPDDADHVHLYKAVKPFTEEKATAFWRLAAASKPSKDTSHIDSIRDSYGGNTDKLGLQEWSCRLLTVSEQ